MESPLQRYLQELCCLSLQLEQNFSGFKEVIYCSYSSDNTHTTYMDMFIQEIVQLRAILRLEQLIF